MNNEIYIAPSILSADLLRLKEQVRAVETAGASFIHVDVMDGHFVPNLTFGPYMVKALKHITQLPLDVHLMISNPDQYIEVYAKAGANIITVHQEACVHLHRTIQTIHYQGVKAGVSLNPATPLVSVENILYDIDLLLIMTVNPGFGGQQFIERGMKKIADARQMIERSKRKIFLEVDGGVNEENIGKIVKNGARVLVAGSAVFAQKDVGRAVKNLFREANNVL